ncbi:hypothetical protein IPA_01630 [Ignicoccus pacificus DSM 13166]|uniref:Uncharacterized protein n=1 Tax=Ignicoccus pacificus DSM 13166 TaxID=940294 RepID=A0A977PKJ9_9CREN|nr:hypothetical protein IPA_01630 [Ignicoccus pacificus DSM 13166]
MSLEIDFNEYLRNDQLEDPPLEFLGTFVNITPYMGGSFDNGKTFRGNRFIGHPTAQAIKARARYASLLALTSFITSPQSYKDAFKIKVIIEGDKEEIPLLCLIYGCVDSHQFGSPFHLIVKNVRGAKKWRNAGNRKAKDRYNAILRRNDKRMELAPAETGTVSFELHVSVDEDRLVLLELTPREIEILKEIFESSVLVALSLFGIGKAASRGFGRFWKKDEELTFEKLIENVEKLLEHWKELLSKLKKSDKLKIYKDEIELKDDYSKDIIIGKVPHLGFIPRIKTEFSNELFMRSRAPIDTKIEMIARAVLKSNWRRRSSGGGARFHTWPLGLPRSSKIKCTCYGYDGNYQRYGYFVTSMISPTREIACEHSRPCGGSNIPTTEDRHQSMVYFIPLKEGIVIVPFFTDAMKDELIFTRTARKLYHVGGIFVEGKPCCNRRFISVSRVLLGRDPIKFPEAREGCDCGSERLGIARPPRRSPRLMNEVTKGSRGRDDRLYREALAASLEWTIFVLKRRF